LPRPNLNPHSQNRHVSYDRSTLVLPNDDLRKVPVNAAERFDNACVNMKHMGWAALGASEGQTECQKAGEEGNPQALRLREALSTTCDAQMCTLVLERRHWISPMGKFVRISSNNIQPAGQMRPHFFHRAAHAS
jgi:hypothetical protein